MALYSSISIGRISFLGQDSLSWQIFPVITLAFSLYILYIFANKYRILFRLNASQLLLNVKYVQHISNKLLRNCFLLYFLPFYCNCTLSEVSHNIECKLIPKATECKTRFNKHLNKQSLYMKRQHIKCSNTAAFNMLKHLNYNSVLKATGKIIIISVNHISVKAMHHNETAQLSCCLHTSIHNSQKQGNAKTTKHHYSRTSSALNLHWSNDLIRH